jgi:rhodanese-related sulfurtransferase
MTKVSIEEVGARLADKNFQIVDTRAPEVWEKAEDKAAGAIRVPPDEAEKHLADLSRDDYIVTYCT